VARGTSEVPEQADERMSRAWNRILRHVTLFSNIRQINTFVLSEVSATSWLIRFIARFLHSGTQRISGKERRVQNEKKRVAIDGWRAQEPEQAIHAGYRWQDENYSKSFAEYLGEWCCGWREFKKRRAS
jgi:hypothetical protein